MQCIEQRPNQRETTITQQEVEKTQSWTTYLQQLEQQFRVDFTQVGISLKLGLVDQRLFIAIGRTYVSVSYGEASIDGMTTHAEISFDITVRGQLVPSEIVFTDEVWGDFQAKLRQANQLPSDEHGFDGARFAVYLLYKISQEGWFDADRLAD